MPNVVNGVELRDRTVEYLGTILWAETVMLPVPEEGLSDGCMDVDEDHPLHGVADCDVLDSHFGLDDFTAESLHKAQEELDDWFDYLERHGLYELAEEYGDDGRIAHDFWLTRNGHGAGYWDGDYGDRLGRTLTDACKAWGGQHVWVDENGSLHLEDGQDCADCIGVVLIGERTSVKFWEHDGDFVPLSRAAFKRAVDGMDESIFAIETEQFILVG